MINRRPKYSEEYISYYPFLVVGRLGVCSIALLNTVALPLFMAMLFDNTSSTTRMTITIACFLVPVISIVAVFYLRSIMFTRITITHDGVKQVDKLNQVTKQFVWTEVAKVYFRRDYWYGKTFCEVHLLNSEEALDVFKMPLTDVDEEKLLKFIPSSLWGNNPMYNL